MNKNSQVTETYLGKDPDSSEVLDFLRLTEGREITHYELLSAMTKGVKNRQFALK
ncbi:MAG TPA: hypothetical protein VKA91_04195 [Nitrososphaeraceae archaeon]|nr:hypothetical protein [Nitrososphaeraceae archaeon]